MRTESNRPWHACTTEETFAVLETSPDGLSAAEIAKRREQYGPNRLPPPKQRGPLIRFLSQFHNALIYVLLAAGVITALLGEVVDSGVIFGVVVINAIIGFIQEGKAEQALASLRAMLAPEAVVTRAGRRQTVPAEDLVLGDVVHLASGDKVPADLRLISARSLRVQEAALTGESVSVEKASASVAPDADLAERASVAYSGTLVTSGRGTGVVVATGRATEIGHISSMLAEVETLTTPLLRQMGVFGRWLTLAILVIAALAFVLGVGLRGYTPAEMFMVAVGIAVAAIPEGLPAIMTITLAIGVTRMARRNAIIRRLPAVETLGAVTIICTDKTGTLTRNELLAETVMTPEGRYRVSGQGYAPEGRFLADGSEVDPAARSDLHAILRAALLCNEASLDETEGEWRVAGDPTDGALLAAAAKAGFDRAEEEGRCPRCDMIPFESEHRFMASLHADGANGFVLLIKGAPERMFELCRTERQNGQEAPIDLEAWRQRADELAAAGQRVIAVASRAEPAANQNLAVEDVTRGELTLLGLFGLIDPPREEAIAAVARCQEAGIRVKMITGDHAATAAAIGRALGIGDGRTALTGRALDTLDDAALAERALEVDVFARAAPAHKLRLVEALQSQGQVLAMTGDGVNDAPALKRADVGIAMGQKGTEAAKEAAEMVLADDNFASIAAAVEQGRTVYDNLRKAILFILPTNGGEALIILVALALGIVLPMTPVQILWVNMITAVTLALALAFEPAEPDVMRRPPRRPGAPLLSGFMIWRIAWVGALLGGGALGLFLYARAAGMELAAARSLAVNALVVGEAFYLLNSRRITASCLNWSGLTGNRIALLTIAAVLLLQLLYTYAPFMAVLFDSAPLGWEEWGAILLFGLALFLLVEAEKAVLRAWHRRRM
jgi:magnesium-transporting ATPase (P-type)